MVIAKFKKAATRAARTTAQRTAARTTRTATVARTTRTATVAHVHLLMRRVQTVADMRACLKYAKPLSWYKPGKVVEAHDKMQNYKYVLTAAPGKNFDPLFRPQVSPGKMLKLGVFEGKYLNDCMGEFPREWYKSALTAGKLSPEAPDDRVNLFKIKSRQSLRQWRANGWIGQTPNDRDVRGWFQWYCRYWLGRRIPNLDAIQIARWRAFVRHAGQITASYRRMANPPTTSAQKALHRPKQRQALLQWAYNPWL
jgi:hypothetical protein